MNHTEHEAATSTTEIKSIPAKSDNKSLSRPSVMIVILLLMLIIPMLVQYFIYLSGQEEAIKLAKLARPYHDYEDQSRTEMLEEMYDFYAGYSPLTGRSNLEADHALGDSLSVAGFHTNLGSHYLKHTNLFAYLKGEHPIQFYLTCGLLLFLLILYLIVSSLVSSNRRKEICVKDDLVVCTSGAGQKLELLPVTLSAQRYASRIACGFAVQASPLPLPASQMPKNSRIEFWPCGLLHPSQSQLCIMKCHKATLTNSKSIRNCLIVV